MHVLHATLLVAIFWLVACGSGVRRHPWDQASSGGGTSSSSGGSTGETGGFGGRAGGAGSGGTAPAPTPSVNGTPNCRSPSDCESGVCAPDVTGVDRCCAANCLLQSRVCSETGDCVCPSGTEEAAGECRLSVGAPCTLDDQCAGNHCSDGVCCEASCDRVCERCNGGGRCVLDPNDERCVDAPGFECVLPGRCRLPLGESCGLKSDCDSEACEPARNGGSVCCEASCRDTCQLCGATGVCDDYPATDTACETAVCEASSTCRRFRPPQPKACAANAVCAVCEEELANPGVPCSVGRQCDGLGACRTTQLGRVAAGAAHTCAILTNGNVVCWGANGSGQLGTAFEYEEVGDRVAIHDVRLELDFDDDVLALTAGLAHTCALFEGGGVRCWGVGPQNSQVVSRPVLLGVDAGSAPTEGFIDPLIAENVHLSEAAVQISAGPGGSHTCALLASGEVTCWGENTAGQCGDGQSTDTPEPVGSGQHLPVVDLGGARALEVRASDGHTCALLEGGDVTCWGANRYGQLGYGNTSQRLKPEGTVQIGEPALAVAVAAAFTCVLLDGGRVRCWGENDDGQLGYGNVDDFSETCTPEAAAAMTGSDCAGRAGDVPLGGLGVIQLVPVVDSEGMCALFAGGAVRCWGRNSDGELGYGHSTEFATAYTPAELARDFRGGNLDLRTPAVALAEGGRCAILEPPASGDSPALYCWGRNDAGQLGVTGAGEGASLDQTPFEIGAVDLELGPP
ncbi:MAG TPA: hypothetical protein VGK73_16925 [Polyangiaceae bacterium]